jgi:transposase
VRSPTLSTGLGPVWESPCPGSKQHLSVRARQAPGEPFFAWIYARSLRVVAAISKERVEPDSGSDLGRYRWVVERTFAWLHNFKRLLVRYERRAEMQLAMPPLGCCVVCYRRLRSSI